MAQEAGTPAKSSAEEKKDSAPDKAPADPRAAEIVKLFQEGMTLRKNGRDPEAAVVFEKAAAKAKEVLGPEQLDTGHLMMQQADALLARDPAKAALLYAAALPILKRHLPREHQLVTYTVNQLALAHGALKRFDEALELDLENLKVREASLGKDHPHTLLSQCNVGIGYSSTGKWEEVVRFLGDWLQRSKEGQSANSPLKRKVLLHLGRAESMLGQLTQAESHLKAVLDNHWGRYAEDDDIRTGAILDMVRVCGASSPPRIDEARRYLEEGAAWCRKQSVPNVFALAAAEQSLAHTYLRANKGAEGVALFEKIVRTYDRGGSGEKWLPDQISSRFDLAKAYLMEGRPNEAESICLAAIDLLMANPRTLLSESNNADVGPSFLARACTQTGHSEQCRSRLAQWLANVKTALGEESPSHIRLLIAVGHAHSDMGLHADGKPLLLEGIRLAREKLGPDDSILALGLERLGSLCTDTADYAEAESSLSECVRILRKAYGNDSPKLVLPLSRLGFVAFRTDRLPEAEKTLREAIRIDERNGGTHVNGYIASLGYLGRLCVQERRFQEAEALIRKDLEVTEQSEGPESVNMGWCLRDMAELYCATNRPAEAEEYYRRSLRIFEKTLGKDHPSVATALSQFSEFMAERGQHEEGKMLRDRSNAIFQASSGGSQRDRLATFDRTVADAVRRNDWTEAVRVTTDLRRLAHRWLKNSLPSVEPDKWLDYLGPYQWWSLDRSLSVGLRYASRPEVVEASAEWLLNGKATGAELLAGQIRQARQSQDPAVAKLVSELREVRERLSRQMLDAVSTIKPGDELRARERELSRQLGLVTREAGANDDWYTLEELRKAIPADAVLIDIARFGPFDFATESQGSYGPAQYVAWVIPSAGKGAVQLIPLGPADPIDTAVARSRRVMDWVRGELSRNRRWTFVGDTTLTETNRLATLVWKPLQAAVGNARTLIISPDGPLWLFPWQAIPLSPAKFLVEDKQIQYVTSARELLDRPSENLAKGGVLFANPDYDVRLTSVRDSTDDVFNKMKQQSKSWGLLTGAGFHPVPNGKEDAAALTTVLDRYLKGAPKVYSQQEALESTFKKMSPPHTLVIYTHGFFRAAPKADRLPTAGQGGTSTPLNVRQNLVHNADPGRLFYHPLLRCGLAFAGANHYAEGNDSDDGILTGMEVLNADFRGTDLVVLLACQTGLGSVQDGEGVAGLHQAFQLAGAKTVLASLWSIPTIPSSELVRMFLDNLAKSQTKTAALHEAQLSLIAEQRKTIGIAHPVLWAGLVLIGNGR
jgi:CHAT domain-containing protein